MPLINVKLIKSVFTPAKINKQQSWGAQRRLRCKNRYPRTISTSGDPERSARTGRSCSTRSMETASTRSPTCWACRWEA
jgi:hypothetical protein